MKSLLPLQWRGTRSNYVDWMGHEWTSSLRAANRLSAPLTHSGWAAVHFYREHLPAPPKNPPQTQHLSSDTMEAQQPAMKLHFTKKKRSRDLKESTQSVAIRMWSKIDLRCTLMRYEGHHYYNTMHLPLLDYVAYSTRAHAEDLFFCLWYDIKKVL